MDYKVRTAQLDCCHGNYLHLCLPADLAVDLAGVPCHLTTFFQQLLSLSLQLLTQHLLPHLGGERRHHTQKEPRGNQQLGGAR